MTLIKETYNSAWPITKKKLVNCLVSNLIRSATLVVLCLLVRCKLLCIS